MADYVKVDWPDRSPITAEKLYQMSENIQYIKDLADNAPHGILSWGQRTTDVTFAGNPRMRLDIVSPFNVNVTVDTPRSVKVHVDCWAIWGGGTSTAQRRVKVVLFINNKYTAARETDVERAYLRTIDDLDFTFGLTPGTHRITIKAGQMLGDATSNPKIMATAAVPMQFWIEDLGPLVLDSTEENAIGTGGGFD